MPVPVPPFFPFGPDGNLGRITSLPFWYSTFSSHRAVWEGTFLFIRLRDRFFWGIQRGFFFLIFIMTAPFFVCRIFFDFGPDGYVELYRTLCCYSLAFLSVIIGRSVPGDL